MNKKGVITEVDNINRTAKATFRDLDDTVTTSLTILDHVTDLSVNDVVAVMFFSKGYADGVIVGRIGGGA